jgi:outer membrane protein insertion porin family
MITTPAASIRYAFDAGETRQKTPRQTNRGRLRGCKCGSMPANGRAARRWILMVYAAACSVVLPALLRAQSSFEGKTIVSVGYEPSTQPLAEADLKRVTVLVPGAPLKISDVEEAINRLFATGRYTDIQVDAEPRANGVAIVFRTTAARFFGHVQASGKISNPPSPALIVNTAELPLGSQFDPDLLTAAKKNIEHLFAANGLYDADIRLETIEEPDQQMGVRIVVNSGPRARYSMPSIHGEPKLSDATIVRATGWRIRFIGRWRKVTQALTNEGIEGISKKYQKEDRLTATTTLTALDYDPETVRVKPSLDINAGPKVHIRMPEARVSKSRLRRFVPVYQEGAVDPDLLVEGERNLRDYFQSKGYPDVNVTFRQLPPADDQKTIEYFITRGPRRKLVRVFIRGNHYFDTVTIRERMYLEPASLFDRWGRYSDSFRKKDEQSIADLYKSSGFRDVNVTSRVETRYGGNASQIAVVFSIEEGAQWRISEFSATGLDRIGGEHLVSILGAGPGQPYSETTIAEDRSVILQASAARGFRHATFQFRASPSGPHEVALTYRVNPGTQEFVRDVVISGLHTTKPELVQKQVTIRPGDPLSLPADREIQRSLYNLGIFAEIDTAIQNSDGDETYKYVLFDFTEAHRYTLNLGVGAEIAQLGPTTTAISEPVGATGFSPRLSVNVNRLNVGGVGHTLALQTLLSTLEQRIGLSFIVPRLFDSPTRSVTYSFLWDTSRDIRTFSSHREEGSVQFAEHFTRRTVGLFRFAYRRVSISDLVIPALLIPQFLQPVRIGIVSANIVQDHRDNSVDPHSGIYNTADIGVASTALGSQRNFTKFLLRNATYTRIGKQLVFARQTVFGGIVPFNTQPGITAAVAVPLPERFFGGGDISLRAFPENQAGPRDIGSPAGPGGTQTEPTGFPLGGDAVFINNLEVRFPLIGQNIGGVLFHDMGNIYENLSSISFRYRQRNPEDFDYMVHAVGFGIRYRTPVGPLRVDLAYGLNPPSFYGFSGTIQQLLACNPNLPPSQLPAQCQPRLQGISHFQYFFSIGQTF